MKLIRNIALALLLAGAASLAFAGAAGKEDRAPTDDEELAIAALEGLMSQPPARALPILRKVMAGSQSNLVKRRALFVIGQLNSAESRDILMQTAHSADTELRGEAIRSIGIGGDSKALDSLMAVYQTGDDMVKKNVTEAFLIAGRKDLMFQIATAAKTEEERNHAIHLLGAMGATDELRKLGDSPKQSTGLLDAYAISSDLEGLLKLVQSSPDHATRVAATQRIGIIHSDAARMALREIYRKTADPEIKDSALQGLLIAQDDKGVLELYRAAKTAEEKRSLLRMLSIMGSDAALEAIDSTLEKK